MHVCYFDLNNFIPKCSYTVRGMQELGDFINILQYSTLYSTVHCTVQYTVQYINAEIKMYSLVRQLDEYNLIISDHLNSLGL